MDTVRPVPKQSGRREKLLYKEMQEMGLLECTKGQDQSRQLGFSSRDSALPGSGRKRIRVSVRCVSDRFPYRRISGIFHGLFRTGTAESYENIDVKGKLVLIDINQREEWWINFPVYQAHLKGAAALIAVQDQGYGEIHDTSLNAQDIAGPKEAAAFSISQADAAILKGKYGKNWKF